MTSDFRTMNRIGTWVLITTLAAIGPVSNSEAATILYDQDFESPVGFVNDGGDVNIFRTVNQLYGNQPTGFVFTQQFTVETLLITGASAFGTGYSDPSGTGGNYALGMLSSVQNDLLGLAFNVGTNDFLNVSLDISSIDLSTFGGPFVPAFPPGAAPMFEFTLFDNPGGAPGLGSGTILDSAQGVGTASPRDVFDWTSLLLPLDASGSTDGNVILRIDLLSGGYAAMDNFLIAASDVPGDVDPPPVAEPTSLLLLGVGGAGLLAERKRRRARGRASVC
jgi:hypothetical protein